MIQGAKDSIEMIQWVIGLFISVSTLVIGALIKMVLAHKQHVAENYVAKDDFKAAIDASQTSMDRQFSEVNRRLESNNSEVNNKLGKIFDLFMDKKK